MYGTDGSPPALCMFDVVERFSTLCRGSLAMTYNVSFMATATTARVCFPLCVLLPGQRHVLHSGPDHAGHSGSVSGERTLLYEAWVLAKEVGVDTVPGFLLSGDFVQEIRPRGSRCTVWLCRHIA